MELTIRDIASKKVFWDVDIDKLSLKNDKDFIIPRILLATTKETFNNDMNSLERIYTPDEIYTALKITKERISNQVCKMVAERYNKPSFFRYLV